MGNVETGEIEIPARDGYPLAATQLEPVQGAVRQATVVAPAMGVPRSFYRAFARFLAERGHGVISFDYRGIGGSAPDRIRGFEASLFDWARLDLAGAIDLARERWSSLPLTLAGHSVAGQILGLVPNADRLDRALVVASVKGYWRRWAGRRAAALWALSHVAFPLAARVLGYLPARWVGLGGEDLPRGVALDWARWVRHPDYVVDEQGRHPAEDYASYRGELKAICLTDDWYAPAEGVEALLEMYPNARTEHRPIDPAQEGLASLGHFGFFRPASQPLWAKQAAWLEAVGDRGTRARDALEGEEKKKGGSRTTREGRRG